LKDRLVRPAARHAVHCSQTEPTLVYFDTLTFSIPAVRCQSFCELYARIIYFAASKVRQVESFH